MKRKEIDPVDIVQRKKPKYYTYKTDIVRCSKCKWNGQGNTARLGDLLDFGFYLDCPQCNNEFIQYIEYPSSQDIKEFGTEEEHKELAEREFFWNNYENRKLKSPDQIRDIEDKDIVFYWHIEKDEQQVLFDNKGSREIIWSEPALYESYSRYVEIGGILKEKFGSRFMDFIPTKESELYLYGDLGSSITIVAKFRKSLR